MGVQYCALRGIFALVICLFALCDISLASDHNSNVGSGDGEDGANAFGNGVPRRIFRLDIFTGELFEAEELMRQEAGVSYDGDSLASYNNSNVGSGDDGGAGASGKVTYRVPSLQYLALEKLSEMPESKRQELGVSYDKNSLICGGTMINLTNTIHDEILSKIKDFELSEGGQKAEEKYKTKDYFGRTILRVSLPVDKNNIYNFIELQAFVSPKLRKALKLYLFLQKESDLEIEINKERKDYLRCLCADDYTAEKQNLLHTVVLDKARYISPLVEAARFSTIFVWDFMSKEFPLSLSNNRYLTELTLKNTDFSEDGSCDILLHSALSSNIKDLHLSECKLPQNFGNILSGMTKLKRLGLKDCLRGYHGVQDVLKSIPNTVIYLDLYTNDFLKVPKLPELPLLKHLDLRFNRIEDYPSSVNGLWQPTFPGLYQKVSGDIHCRV